MQTQENMSEDKVLETEESKLVPVTESIRYRKRAQSAEKKVEELTELLSQSKQQSSNLTEELTELRNEQKLTQKLINAGTVDIESALLLAKVRMESQQDVEIDDVIEQLKQDKQHLFRNSEQTVTSGRTSGAKDRNTDVHTVLAKAAKKAAQTGSRIDLQEYLKMRRNYL